MKYKLSVIILLILIMGVFFSPCYGEEKTNIDSQEKLINDLNSDDASTRNSAIDTLIDESFKFLSDVIKNYQMKNTLNENDKMIKSLIIMVFEKVGETSTKPIKDSLRELLQKKENRDLYAPALGTMLQIFKEMKENKTDNNSQKDPNSI